MRLLPQLCLFLTARVLDCGRERRDGSERRGAGLKPLKMQPYAFVCERGQMSAAPRAVGLVI